MMDDLSSLTAAILTISFATERLITAIKTAAPTWFAEEKRTAAQETDLIADRFRRFRVLGAAYLASWTSAALFADGGFDYLGWIGFGASNNHLPVFLLGLLATGGSAFWANAIGYLGAAKDIRLQQKASDGLSFKLKAEQVGVSPVDTGRAARSEHLSGIGAGATLKTLLDAPQPPAGVTLTDVQ